MTRGTHRGRGVVLLVLASFLLVPSTPAAAGIDAPDTCAAATPITPGTAWVSDSLTPAGDRDWYRFTLTGSSRMLITLGGLAINARLDLYGACGAILASSDRSGRTYEDLSRILPAGTYRVRVMASGGASTARLHSLQVRTIPDRVIVLSSSAWIPFPSTFPQRPRVVGEVINGTRENRQDIKIRIRFYDATDLLIDSRFTWARRERIKPGARSMFTAYWGEDVPGFDHVRVSVARAPMADEPPTPGLAASLGGTTPDGFGGLTYWGTLTNTGGRAIGTSRVMVTVYDALGRVRNADFSDPAPDPLPAGASTPWEVHLDDRTTGNRVVITPHGYRH